MDTHETIKTIDLDPREKAELLDVLDYAMENGAYLHIEVRKATNTTVPANG